MAQLPIDDDEIQKTVSMQLADALREDGEETASASQNPPKPTRPFLKAARNLNIHLLGPEEKQVDCSMLASPPTSITDFENTYSLMGRLIRNSKHSKQQHMPTLSQFPKALAAFGTVPRGIDEQENSSASSSLAGAVAPASGGITKKNKGSLDTCKLLGMSNLPEVPTSSLKSDSTKLGTPAISPGAKLILLPKDSPFNMPPPKGCKRKNPKRSHPRDSADNTIRVSPVPASTQFDTNFVKSSCSCDHCQREQYMECQQTEAPKLDNQSKKDEQKSIERKVEEQLCDIDDIWDIDPTAPVCNKDNSKEIEEELLFAMDDMDI